MDDSDNHNAMTRDRDGGNSNSNPATRLGNFQQPGMLSAHNSAHDQQQGFAETGVAYFGGSNMGVAMSGVGMVGGPGPMASVLGVGGGGGAGAGAAMMVTSTKLPTSSHLTTLVGPGNQEQQQGFGLSNIRQPQYAVAMVGRNMNDTSESGGYPASSTGVLGGASSELGFMGHTSGMGMSHLPQIGGLGGLNEPQNVMVARHGRTGNDGLMGGGHGNPEVMVRGERSAGHIVLVAEGNEYPEVATAKANESVQVQDSDGKPGDVIMEESAPTKEPKAGGENAGHGDFAVDEESGLGVKRQKVDEECQDTQEQGEGPTGEELADVVLGEKKDPKTPAGRRAMATDELGEEAPSAKEKCGLESASLVKESKSKPGSKKRMSKPLKKVLTAKKEIDIAHHFFHAEDGTPRNRDLADAIPLLDCFFLGKEFWVFTHEQLDFLVKRGLGDESPLEGEADGDRAAAPTRNDILTKIKESEILDHKKETRKVTGGDPMEIDGDAAAEAKLRKWKSLLEKAKDRAPIPMTVAFPFSGAVSCLLTPAIRNFLETVKVKNVFLFMSLKKTETGAICDYLLTWRAKCGMSSVPHLGVAKYLLGFNSRLEMALSSVPPVEEEKRHWMMDPIIVMTGAAREFLVDDQKLTTAFDFVHTRTKDLSLALAAWRQRKGFVPLKGSGKVAMISGWKATAKEVLEIEAGVGKVLEGDDLEGLEIDDISSSAEQDYPPPKDRKRASNSSTKPNGPTRKPSPKVKEEEAEIEDEEEGEEYQPPIAVVAAEERKSPTRLSRQSTSKQKKRLASGRSKAYYDLHSKQFLDETLGERATDVLASVSLHTAHQLFEASEETRASLVDEIIEAELVDDIGDSEVLVEQWIITLKKILDVPDVKDDEEESEPRKRQKTDIETKAKSSTEESSGKSKKTKPHHKTVTGYVKDPFELLSSVTRRFLSTVGITTAKQFLTTRTTDIAAEFVTFRQNEGMADLKGLGSIASVSGWKANCRKYCKSMGTEYWDRIAELEPVDKFSPKGVQSGLPPNQQKTDTAVNAEMGPEDDIPFAPTKRLFAVQGSKEYPLQFKFDLSLRKSVDTLTRDQDIFITFKGSSQRFPAGPPPKSAAIRINGIAGKYPVLSDTLLTKAQDRSVDIRATFHTTGPGCGLIELKNLGVRPFADQDLSTLKKMVRAFILSTPNKVNVADEKDTPGEVNVIIKRTSFEGAQYMFFVGEPIETGQTVPIIFPSILDVLRSGTLGNSCYREYHKIVEAFHVLSKNDVRTIISFATEIAGDIDLEGLIDAADSEAINEETKNKVRTAVRSRARLRWLCCHLFGLAEVQSPEEEETLRDLYFGVGTDYAGNEAHSSLAETLQHSITQELKRGILALLEFDTVCGDPQRQGWCKLASELFEDVISVVTACGSEYPSAVKKTLLEMHKKISELALKDGNKSKWVFKLSPLSSGKDNVVVCEGTDDQVSVIEVQDAMAFEDGTYEVAIDWYKSFLLQIQYKVIHCCGFLLNSTEFPYVELLDSIKPLSELEDEKLLGVEYEQMYEAFPNPAKSLSMVAYQPHTYQFFLGIVWPTLRDFGWRMKVTKYPSETVYVVPQWKSEQHKQGKLAKLAKQQRDRKRGELARGVNQMGLGSLPKPTKRLFIASKPPENDADNKKKPPRSTKHPSNIVDLFLEGHFKKGTKLYERAESVLDLVLECFDSFAPSLCKEANSITLDESKLPRETCPVDIFMQFLLVLPSLLTQSEVPHQEINDSLQVVQDLTSFCSDHAAELFSKGSLPPTEHYAVEEKRPTPHLVHRLRRGVKKGGSGECGELVEVIWEEDKKDLSDFVVTVMEQVVACRATEEDTMRKHRKIHVGYPGAVCRHCMGRGQEGRYFFTTIESLTTLGTVFEKHFAKCPYVPAETKRAITTNKARHHEQRKDLPNGSQQAYFLKLWDRLRTMRISGDDSGVVPVTQQALTIAAEEQPKKHESTKNIAAAHESIEFHSPLEVLDFLRNTSPWSGTKEIDDVLNQYYTCIDFGGRIYNTRTMPKHFSPAWLLAKVGPKRTTKKRTNLPG